MESNSNSTIEPKKAIQLVGVGIFMFWFLHLLESSISNTFKTFFFHLSGELNLNISITYPIKEFVSVSIVLIVFFKLVGIIKRNYKGELYLRKMTVLFLIGIVLSILFLMVSPSIISFFFIEFSDFEVNENYIDNNTFYVKLISDILTTTIKISVIAYIFLNNTNFQNSSASS